MSDDRFSDGCRVGPPHLDLVQDAFVKAGLLERLNDVPVSPGAHLRCFEDRGTAGRESHANCSSRKDDSAVPTVVVDASESCKTYSPFHLSDMSRTQLMRNHEDAEGRRQRDKKKKKKKKVSTIRRNLTAG